MNLTFGMTPHHLTWFAELKKHGKLLLSHEIQAIEELGDGHEDDPQIQRDLEQVPPQGLPHALVQRRTRWHGPLHGVELARPRLRLIREHLARIDPVSVLNYLSVHALI